MARKRKAGDAHAINLRHAYAELTREEFAVWIRLAIEPQQVLDGGLGRMAPDFDYGERQFREVLRRLRNKGFVRIEKPARPCLPASLYINRRPLLVGYDHFVKI